jgi:uncharacterized protein (DUF427 family)
VGLAWQQGPLSEGAIGRFLVPDPLTERLLDAGPLRRRLRVRFDGNWIADSDDDERIVGHAADPYHRIDIGQTSRHLVTHHGDRVVADSASPLALYESGFAPRWHVPRADGGESALTLAAGQTFCPYKGLCSYYDIADARRAAWSYEDAWTEVRRVFGPVSSELDKIEVYLHHARLRLEPGQSVIPHGVDRDFTLDEAPSSGRQP